MNTKRLQEKFKEIGAKLNVEEIPEPRYVYQQVIPYTVSLKNTRGASNTYVIAVLKKAIDSFEVEVHAVDKKKKQLLLEVRLLDDHRNYLCGINGRVWDIEQVPPGPSGIRRAARVLNERKSQKRQSEEPSRIIEQNHSTELPARSFLEIFQKIHPSSKMTDEDYDFRAALQEKCKRLKMTKGTQYAIPQYGTSQRNTYENALIRVAACRKFAVRDLAEWTPKSRNAHKQFASLVRHLFANYAVPGFLDSVWFREDEKWIMWFIEIGSGKNIRKIEKFPMAYTKKMAFNMFQSPGHYSIEQAIRWGQVSAIGGNNRFFTEMERTNITKIYKYRKKCVDQHAFWQTVMTWFLRNPMLDPAQYGPIVDYVNHQKFARPKENPDFEITGRTPRAVLRLVDDWHGALGQATRQKFVSWKSHGFDWVWKEKEKNKESGREKVKHTWTIKEVLNSTDLINEGKEMHHCVYTYTNSCVSGRSIILSLRRDEKRLLTVEYLPKIQRIGEVRGVSNRLPKKQEVNVLSRWAKAKSLQDFWLLTS
jgi:hypothetical protein